MNYILCEMLYEKFSRFPYHSSIRESIRVVYVCVLYAICMLNANYSISIGFSNVLVSIFENGTVPHETDQ